MLLFSVAMSSGGGGTSVDHGELPEQVAIVTGAGRGIGRAIACALSRAGASVALVARCERELAETAAMGERMFALSGDVRDVAATTGTQPFPFLSATSVAKSAILRLTEGLAISVAPYGVRAFAIHPGVIDTQVTRSYVDSPSGADGCPRPSIGSRASGRPRRTRDHRAGAQAGCGSLRPAVREAAHRRYRPRPTGLHGRRAHRPGRTCLTAARLMWSGLSTRRRGLVSGRLVAPVSTASSRAWSPGATAQHGQRAG